MKKNAQKNLLLLAVTGVVLLLVNGAVFMGVRNGQIAPVDNLMLWGAFAVLNVCSLLWAVSLLGLQPMVLAVAYTTGGFLAFRGVRLMPDMHVAEIASAGATYGAFGALLVGNATTKVRLAFFNQRQVPFVFAIMALLVMDGFLQGRVSGAGWNVIAHALVFPFMLAGVVVGLVWMILMRIRASQASPLKATEVVAAADPVLAVASDDEETDQLMFSVPEDIGTTESVEVAELAPNPEPAVREVPRVPMVEAVSVEADPMVDDADSDNFFPLEIDKDETAILQEEEDPELMNLAAMVAESAPEPAVEAEPVFEHKEPLLEEIPPRGVEDMVSLSEELPVLEPVPVEEAKAPVVEEEKTNSSDWLSGHLDLLNKLEK